MNIPTSQPIPDENEPLSAARRRRERRLAIPSATASKDERAAFLNQLADQAVPTLDYYIFSLIAGIIMGAGLLLDSPALLVVGAVLTPLAGPYLGLGLSCIAGSGRCFLQSIAAAALGAAVACGGGYLAGVAARLLPGISLGLHQANALVQFSWPALVALSLGAVVATLAFARSSKKAELSGAILTFLLFPPVVAVGFGLAARIPDFWPYGLVVFAVYLAWATLLSALTLGLLGLRPLTGFGFLLGAAIAVACLAVLAGLGGVGMAMRGQTSLPVVQPTDLPTRASAAPPSETPAPTSTTTPIPSPTHTLIPSETPTLTFTPAPTPVWAIVTAPTGDGALIRAEPRFGSKILRSALNGTLLQVLPDTVTDTGTVWVHVKTTEGQEGWIVQGLLATATPVPGW